MPDTERRPEAQENGRCVRKKKDRLTRGQRLLMALAVLLAAALAVTLAHRKLVARPDIEKTPLVDGLVSANEADTDAGIRPKVDGQRKSADYYTVLILGRDTGGGGNTDTMLLASYDVTNQKATVMSIPRDTMVNVSWDVKKINSVYNSCGGGEEGIQGLYREISQLVGFEPDFRVVLEWEAVGALVEAIGGVEFDVPYDMDYDDDVQDLHIHQAAGVRRLSGEDAMQVIRWRENNNDSPYGYRKRDGGIGDSGRMKVQQAFLKAVIQQTLTIQNALNIRKIAKVFQEHVDTDLAFSNICWFAEQAVLGGLQTEDVEFLTMPYRGANAYSRYYTKLNGSYSELAYVTPVADELLELVNEKLSPFAEIFTLADLDIMSVNADGSISSTTGHVEDSQAAGPPVKSAAKPSETPSEEAPAAAPPDVSAETPSMPEEEATAPPEESPAAEPPVIEDPAEPPEVSAPDEEEIFSTIEPPPAA
ncbi:LCP family protein [uncultured Dysosmobacter sp.]|uniref:LCP family protein n=1 Tax=uncultured Dysosmobacter sp. TaxID=2591384 RepID=UPI002617FCEB|nr:LCP family protein [uncultured Dysosmobacter sp.]